MLNMFDMFFLEFLHTRSEGETRTGIIRMLGQFCFRHGKIESWSLLVSFTWYEIQGMVYSEAVKHEKQYMQIVCASVGMSF